MIAITPPGTRVNSHSAEGEAPIPMATRPHVIKQPMRAALIIATLILTRTLLLAADAGIDGKWQGHIATPTGPVSVGFVFTTKGESLGGSTTGIDGMHLPLKNGKIKAQVVSFSVDVDIGGLPAELAYRGMVFGNKIDFRATFMGETFDFTVRRVKN